MSAGFRIQEVLEATGGRLRGQAPASFGSVSTDTRTLQPGALFVALKGENFDGHLFLTKAAQAGAGGALVASGTTTTTPSDFALVEVEDTLVALGLLARFHRRRFSMPVGAITGSNGKTTTKEMIGAILETRGPALKTEGNLNNEIGVPLTLFRLEARHTAAIVEMGMNHPGELARLSRYAEPRCAAITCVAAAHLEGLKSIEAVARAKGEIYEGLPQDGLAIANADDPRVLAEARASGRRVMTYGSAEGTDVRLLEITRHDASGMTLQIGFEGQSHTCSLAFVGRHNALNACGAFAVATALGCTPAQCVEGLAAARPWKHRLSLVEARNGVRVIDDCYNANPSSMAAALDTLRALAGTRRKIAVLGDMLELGEAEGALHRELGTQALAAGVEVLVAVGPRSRETWQSARSLGANAFHCENPKALEGALEFLRSRLSAGDVVLVKGSRGMRLERVVEALTGQVGGAH